MSKTTNKFSPEVRERAVRLVLDNEGQHPCKPAVRAVCADGVNGRKALPYGMRFSCFTNRDLRR